MSNSVLFSLVAIYLALGVTELAGWVEVPKISSFEDNEIFPLFAFNIVKLRQYLLCLILLRVFFIFNNRRLPALAALGDYSFGIYFIHIFLIIIIEKALHKIIPDFQLNSLTFLVYVAVVTWLSVLIVRLVKKFTGKYSRMLIGS